VKVSGEITAKLITYDASPAVTFEVLYLLASLLFDLKLAATNWREVKILLSG
jgi:hypothetical protein